MPKVLSCSVASKRREIMVTQVKGIIISSSLYKGVAGSGDDWVSCQYAAKAKCPNSHTIQ